MTTLLLLAKICVPPILVALMSLAARRWGPTFGGLIMGLPWMTGPILFFLGLDKGADFLVAAARGAELAVWGMGAYILAFGYASRRFGWPTALGAGTAAYAAAGLVTQNFGLPLWLATVGALATLGATYRLLPLPRCVVTPAAPPVWDIPARMIATFTLVSIIMVSADLLGPQRSGIVSSFPVILTVIGSFTLRQSGSDALLRVLRGMSLSLLAFAGFFAVVGFATPRLGQSSAYLAASALALSISAILVRSNRPPAPRPA